MGCSDEQAPAAANVTPENVDVYVAEAKARMSSTTVHLRIGVMHRINCKFFGVKPEAEPAAPFGLRATH